MSDLLSEFEWFRHPSGYKIVDEQPDRPVPKDARAQFGAMEYTRRYLVPIDPLEALVPVRPFSSSDCVTAFARIESEPDLIRFARKYGPLWRGDFASHPFFPSRYGNPFLAAGDSRALDQLSFVNDVDLALKNRYSMAMLLSVLVEPSLIEVSFRDGAAECVYQGDEKPIAWRFRGVDSAPRARNLAIAQIVGHQSRELGALHVALSVEGPNGGRFDLDWHPGHLIGALWIAQALALRAGRRALKCKQCRRPYMAAAKSRGNPRLYCSDRCRKAHAKKEG